MDRSPATRAAVFPARGSEAADIAAALLGQPVGAALPVLGSFRNRLFRVATPERPFMVKLYRGADAAERFGRETRALDFLAAGPLGTVVPQRIAEDAASCAALFEWIEGERPARRGGDELGQVQHFLQSLLAVSRGPVAAEFPPAIGADARPGDLARQIEAQRDRLGQVEPPSLLRRGLGRFDALWPFVRAILLIPQDPARLVLMPEDGGFQNTLRRPDGRLVFLDFETFGWDDPVRLVAHMLWQPGTPVSDAEAACLVRAAHGIFGASDGGFAQRLRRCWPAIALREALRLLDGFLPECRNSRRRFDFAQLETARLRQAARAEALIRRVENRLQAEAA